MSNGIVKIKRTGQELNDIAVDKDTIADLKAMVKLPKKVFVSGYHNKNDGAFGSNFFKLRAGVVPDGSFDNGGTVIETVNGVYDLKTNYGVDARVFGLPALSVQDNTNVLQNALNSTKKLLINDIEFEIYANQVVLNDGNEINGNGTIKCILNSPPEENTHSNIILITTTNNKVSDLSFKGVGNNVFGIGGLADENHICNNVRIDKIKTKNCGIATFEPFQGFTYNRYNEDYVSWIHSGKVSDIHKCKNIKVSNCEMDGDTFYNAADATCNSSTVSGVQFLYCEDASAKDIEVANARFGAWSYGGSPKNSANDNLSLVTKESSRVLFTNIVSKNTHSGAWMSNTVNGLISNCVITDFTDVQVDFEGCEYSVGIGNIVTDVLGLGGAFTALNGCDGISFIGNIYNTKRIASSIYVKDGNSNISYTDNSFANTNGEQMSIKIWNSLSGLTAKNKNIIFNNNRCKEFKVDAQIVDSIEISGNYIQSAEGSAGIMNIYGCNNLQLGRNTVKFDTVYTGTGQASCPVQIVQGGSTQEHKNYVIEDNKILNCSGKTGINIFVGFDSNGNNDIKISGNVTNHLYIHDDFVHTPPDSTKGRLIVKDNYSTIVDSDHTPATTIERTNGGEKYNPTILIGGTGTNNLTGTYKVGDKLLFTAPTAGGKVGKICVAAGTGADAVWKAYALIDS